MDMLTSNLVCRNHNAIYQCTELAKCCNFLEKIISRIENLHFIYYNFVQRYAWGYIDKLYDIKN